jgi:hypothetical protein
MPELQKTVQEKKPLPRWVTVAIISGIMAKSTFLFRCDTPIMNPRPEPFGKTPAARQQVIPSPAIEQLPSAYFVRAFVFSEDAVKNCMGISNPIKEPQPK